ncbi:hypothetical protein EDC01DRAFT_790692 [Geopyxis carbonaria]|nr:hypothetical protein EDC01DRAFT_790692 [Geopyxis carbonaria]
MSETAPLPVRKPGLLELWSTARHAQHLHLRVLLLATYTHPSTPLTPALLSGALASAIHAHPVLALTILHAATPRTTEFARLPRIELAGLYCFHESELDLETLVSTPFDALDSLPPWRVDVVPRPADAGWDVAFSFHHGLMDGESGVYFHHALLAALSTPAPTSLDILTTLQTEHRELTPALEDLLPPASTWRTLAAISSAVLKPLTHRDTWTGPPIVTSRCKTSLRLFPLPRPDALRTRCRRESTTVPSLLHAAFATAILSTPTTPASPATTVSGTIAISLRRFLSLPPLRGTMGVFAGSISCRHDAADGLWDSARRTHAALQRAVNEPGRAAASVGLLRFVRDLETWLPARAGAMRGDGFGVSSLGVVAFDADEAAEGRGEGDGQGGQGWRVAAATFAQSASAVGNALDIGVVGVAGGPGRVAVMWQDGVLAREWVEGVVERVQAILGEAVEEE